jgi:hypothetical protein
MITKEQLQHELEGLRLQLRDAETQVNMIRGAMQTIDQLLVMADEPEVVEVKELENNKSGEG